MNLMKKCKNCQTEKPINEFSIQKNRGKEYTSNICGDCKKQQQKKYIENNKEAKKIRDKEYYERVKNTPEFVQKAKEYRNSRKENKAIYDKNYRKIHKEEYQLYCKENKEAIAEIRHNYYLEHKEDRKKYNQEYYKEWWKDNRERIIKSNSAYISRRLKNDISFRLRSNVSRVISKYLKLNGSSKNGNSILEFLSYSIKELKEHLEKQFEPWMTWNNYGSYRFDKWDDNDLNTWKWNIDHIVPQSDLPYTSMEDDNFKKCWALENLRPLSAKQNLLDGTSKIRHKQKNVGNG